MPVRATSGSGPGVPRWVAPAILSLAVVLAFTLASPRGASASAPAPANEPSEFSPLLRPGSQAPDFAVERLEGGTLRLSALRGRVVLLDFWATWCPPCRAELPWLVPLARRYEPRGLAFVALSQDNLEEQRAEVSRFASGLPGLSRYAALSTPKVGRDFGAESLPTLYLIDRSGRVFASKVGAAEEKEVALAIERALTATP